MSSPCINDHFLINSFEDIDEIDESYFIGSFDQDEYNFDFDIKNQEMIENISNNADHRCIDQNDKQASENIGEFYVNTTSSNQKDDLQSNLLDVNSIYFPQSPNANTRIRDTKRNTKNYDQNKILNALCKIEKEKRNSTDIKLITQISLYQKGLLDILSDLKPKSTYEKKRLEARHKEIGSFQYEDSEIYNWLRKKYPLAQTHIHLRNILKILRNEIAECPPGRNEERDTKCGYFYLSNCWEKPHLREIIKKTFGEYVKCHPKLSQRLFSNSLK